MTAAPRTRPAIALVLIVAVLAAPSVLIAGAVQIAVALDGSDCATRARCHGGGR